jgi:hypothetical protein
MIEAILEQQSDHLGKQPVITIDDLDKLAMIAPKSLDQFKQRIREITRRAKGVSIKTTMEELAQYMRGWRGYFGSCQTPEELIALTRWVRLRLRAALWRQWKAPRSRTIFARHPQFVNGLLQVTP